MLRNRLLTRFSAFFAIWLALPAFAQHKSNSRASKLDELTANRPALATQDEFSARKSDELDGLGGRVSSAAFSPEARYFAVSAAYQREGIVLYDSGFEKIWTHSQDGFGRPGSVAFTPDGQFMVLTGYRDPADVALLDLDTRQVTSVSTKHGDYVNALAISADGRYLCTAGYDRQVVIWEYDGERFIRIQAFESNRGLVNDIAFGGCGQQTHLAVAGEMNSVTIWKLYDKKFKIEETIEMRSNQALSVAISPDARLLAVGGSNETVNVYELDGGLYTLYRTLRGHSHDVHTLAFSPDGAYLASGSSDRSVLIHDVRDSFRRADVLVGHSAAVREVAFSPDGNYLASASDDKSVAIYQLTGVGSARTPDDGGILDSGSRGDTQPPLLSVESVSFSEGVLSAGETAELKVVVKNAGPGEGRDVYLDIKTNENGLDFPEAPKFADIARNGGRQTITVPVSATDGVSGGETYLDIEAVDPYYGGRAQARRLYFETKSAPRPALTLAKFAVLEGESSRPNNRIDLNEIVEVKFVVQNVGKGAANDVEVRVDNDQPGVVFLGVVEAGLKRDEPFFERIPSGKYETVTYRYFVNSEFVHSALKFELTAREGSGRAGFVEARTVEIDSEVREEGEIVVMDGSEPEDDGSGSIEEVPDLEIDIRTGIPKTRAVKPDAVAVVIGNRDYRNRDVPTVEHALDDAALMTTYLQATWGFDPANILFYKNASQADFNGVFGTESNHKGRLFNLVKKGKSDVFVFYSGHGAPDVETKEAYFVPADCDPTLVSLNGYKLETFYANLSKIEYKSLTIVIDACFSGNSEGGALLQNMSPVFIKPRNRVIYDERAAVFTSAGSEQVSSWYPEKEHSLFTYFYLKGVQGAADQDRNGTLTVAEMREYLEEEVPYWARRLHNRTQTPEIYGDEEKEVVSY